MCWDQTIITNPVPVVQRNKSFISLCSASDHLAILSHQNPFIFLYSFRSCTYPHPLKITLNSMEVAPNQARLGLQCEPMDGIASLPSQRYLLPPPPPQPRPPSPIFSQPHQCLEVPPPPTDPLSLSTLQQPVFGSITHSAPASLSDRIPRSQPFFPLFFSLCDLFSPLVQQSDPQTRNSRGWFLC